MKKERNMEKYEDSILYYCYYCKNPILNDDDYVVKRCHPYHIDCYRTMHMYVDDFGDFINDEDYEEDYETDEEDPIS